MLCNEHISKKLFQEAGIAVPTGKLLFPEDASSYKPLGTGPWYVKAQVLIGGRGKAGGVVRVDDPDKLTEVCEKLFSLEINGESVPLLRVEPATRFDRELYLSFMVSRDRERIAFTVARGGGMDVEKQAAAGGGPLVQYLAPSPSGGRLSEHQVRAAFFHLFPAGPDHPENTPEKLKGLWPGFKALIRKCFDAVKSYGLLLLEINPLVHSDSGEWTALDGKVEIDDAVADIDSTLERFYEPAHLTPEENAARAAGLAYLRLDGWVGLMANGAGLAMATMDLLNYAGLRAGNFMDLGGAADQKRMAKAFDMLFSDERVETIFLNLFGGIVSCETVARAVAEALAGAAPPKPLVARLAGHGADEGRKILKGLGYDAIHLAAEVSEAVDILKKLSKGRKLEPFPKDETGAVRAATVREPELPREQQPLPTTLAELGLSDRTRLLVQGITGRAAMQHVRLMQEYGTQVVAGVTPYKGGQQVHGVPVFNSVAEAARKAGPFDASIVFVPAAFAADAMLEAVDNAIPNIICITEGIPQAQMLYVRRSVHEAGLRLFGPNTPGVIVPGQTKIGIMPGQVFTPGSIALLSRSGTLTYEAAARLSAAGLGQSVCIGVGGDPFVGCTFAECFELIKNNVETSAVMLIGEIGGRAEEEFAEVVAASGYAKPLLAFVSGRTAPPGKRLGHAGAILDESSGGIDGKLQALHDAGFVICPDLESLPALARKALGRGERS
ncbi:succinate--CoA ligase subunit alpha [Oceanidesulfovibrio indonesiensis]|uniref:Succinate--CoA ligase subunit alpha n=1 Tax=Oceanidesulfovibrio indonesiensis TaxID=54767 RepID=A0A7M3MGV9_9BACT|nr:succinate--CoA ligase subunit alpha [Oceanidesulfovibrio indonesiensis]TVM18285.1 succinate--CoA ligase subunit alpha [Oceanidesulfovibrio indonesiensis]